MEQSNFKITIKRVLLDRPFLLLSATLVLTGIIYLFVVGLNIRSSDVTVYSRYTAFGEAHFYKSHWQYLLTFVLFGIVVVAGHLGLMVKLHNMERRQTAQIIGWIGIVMLCIAASYALAVMQLGHSS
ncbi:hypothetical protein IPM09_03990 [Candidatus Saccharibacteria bacterium]|nr:MAG: hypothetical protein IPM09_03990 [Candidatus Saccharibacteria bacterium]